MQSLRSGTRRLTVLLSICCCAGPAAATLCTMTPSAMAFGTYDTILSTANDTTATLLVSCVPGVGDPLTTSYTITIAGTGTGGDTVRSMVAGSYRLYYQIYQDGARTVVWGNGTTSGPGVSSSVTSSATLVAGLKTHTAYARMAPLQNKPAAIYGGTVLVTINY